MVINPEEFLFPFVKYSHVFILSGPSHRDDEEKSFFLKISFCKFIFKKAAGRLSQKGKIMINWNVISLFFFAEAIWMGIKQWTSANRW